MPLMREHAQVIKRPVVEWKTDVVTGRDHENRQARDLERTAGEYAGTRNAKHRVLRFGVAWQQPTRHQTLPVWRVTVTERSSP